MATMYNSSRAIKMSRRVQDNIRPNLPLSTERKIIDKVNEILKENGISAPKNKPIETGQPPKDDQLRNKNTQRWVVSVVGKAMSVLQAVSTGVSIANVASSGDDAKLARTTFSSGTSAITLALGTLGGPYGMLASVAIGYLRGLFGQYIENQIQEVYDTRRYQYKLTNYDLSKYSTQTYNSQLQKWVAIDAQRANRAILKNTNIS